ncbi:hypothetical protein BH11BAC2_BH11BAC2_15300 [soil metagenome]
MKSCFNLALISCTFLVIVSCNSRPQVKDQETITKAEAGLFQDSSRIPIPAKADSVINMYLAYADSYQDDTLSAEYLFRAGDLAQGIGRFKKAIEYYGRIQRYPNYRKSPEALFLQGFVSETGLADTSSARQFYEKFLKLYPKHEMVKDAKASLDNMGKTPEELIRQFESKLSGDSSALN